MKKLFSVIMVVALVWGLSVPVAAAQDRPEFYGKFDAAVKLVLEDASRNVPSSYKYVMVTFVGDIEGIWNIRFYFVKSSVIVSQMDYYYTFYQPSTGGLAGYYTSNMKFNSAASDSVYGIRCNVTSSNGVTNIPDLVWGYYLAQFSTTTFANLAQMDSLNNVIINIPVPPVDISVLESLISQVELKVESSYTAATWAILKSALTDAKALLAGGSYTQDSINAMITRLQEAINGLVLISVLPDATPLRVVLAEAKAIDNIGYTVPTWTRLRTAIYEGDELLTRAVYTAPQVATATTNVRRSIDGLELYVTPDPGDHRYLVDGFRVVDLLPAQDAIMANFKQARKFGIFAFIAIIVVHIIVRLIRRLVDFDFVGDTINYEKQVDFGHYHPNFKKMGTKYIDY